jgi:hypothetical protein
VSAKAQAVMAGREVLQLSEQDEAQLGVKGRCLPRRRPKVNSGQLHLSRTFLGGRHNTCFDTLTLEVFGDPKKLGIQPISENLAGTFGSGAITEQNS